jgi:signal transduction histidine kinase
VSSTSSARPARLRRVVPWLCAAVVTAYVGVTVALTTPPDGVQPWSVWTAAAVVVALVLLAAVVAYRAGLADRKKIQRLRAQRDQLSDRAEALTRALDAVVHEQLPAFLASEPAPALPSLGPGPAQARLDEAAATLDRVRRDRASRRDAVEVAVVALGRKVQASAHRIQEEAARMVQRHPTDPDILQTSMRVDHAAAQHARQAQSLAALCGQWPGQQWSEPLPLPDVVKGAAGRITAFHRVDVSGDPGVAVTARVVEPLMHLVAELLSNATQSSPPSTQVLVVLRQVQRGAVIEIDDCGVGLDHQQLERIRDIASGKHVVTIADLGEIPQTGLAVVGTYARRHGFRVELMESVYGGLRAVVMIPGELTERVVTPETPASDDAWPADLPATVPSGLASEPAPGPLDATVSRPRDDAARAPLPQRRSRRADAAAEQEPVPHAGVASLVHTQTAEEAGAWMGAFFGPTAGRPDPEYEAGAGAPPATATSGNDPNDSIEPSGQAGGVAEDR